VTAPPSSPSAGRVGRLLRQARERGVLRVAVSYAVIAWLVLQIADVVIDPLGLSRRVMTALIVLSLAGFPVALGLAWFLEFGAHGIEVDRAPDGGSRPSARGLRHYADAIVIAILVVTIAVLAVRESKLGRPGGAGSPVIAVLPFENLSGHPEQDYFSDGLAAELLDRLGRVPGLAVIARSSSFSFKGSKTSVTTIAERLGATLVMEGSVRRNGQRLRLSAGLVDGATGRQIWSGTFDRDIDDVFKLQEELAGAVVDAVAPAAQGRAIASTGVPTRNMTAYDSYLLGRAAQEARFGQKPREAVARLEDAVAADPDFGKAYAALSRALVLWLVYAYEIPPPDALERAERAAHRALALDPGSSDAHAALATVLRRQGRTAEAASEYERALELNPSNTVALWDYLVLLDDGPASSAHAHELKERLVRLDPRSPMLWQSRLLEAAERNDAAQVSSLADQAIGVLADDRDGLRQVFLAARSEGYAPEAFRLYLAFAKESGPFERGALAMRTWLLVDDFEHARASATEMEKSAGNEVETRVARYMLAEIAGLEGDFGTWDRLVALGAGNGGSAQTAQAFWLAVQQRYPEAARILESVGPLPDTAIGGLGAGLMDGQLLPAVLRVYRASGRAAEADAMAGEYLRRLRDQPRASLDLAALAANEGLDDEAIRTLRDLFADHPLVEQFHPGLPWFRNLEDDPAYVELLAERRRRIDQAHKAMVDLEAEAAGGP
jgi:adenylate cyclase